MDRKIFSDDDKATQAVYRAFIYARDHKDRKTWKEEAEAATRAWDGKPFTEAEEKTLEEQDIPVVKTNKGAINSIRYASIMTASRPEMSAQPVGGGGDIGVATLLKRDFQKIWKNNTANKTANLAVLDSVKKGDGWLDVFPQRYNGVQNRIVIERVNPDSIYLDSGGAFIIKARKISETEAKNIYGLDSAEMHYQPTDDDWTTIKAMTADSKAGGSYTDPEQAEGDALDPKKEWSQVVWEIEYHELHRYSETRKLVEAELQQVKPDDEAEGTIKVVYEELQYLLIVGKKVVERKTDPHGTDHRGKPVDGLINIPNIPSDKAYNRGNLFYARPALQEASKRRGQSMAVVSSTLGSPIMAKEAVIDVDEWRKKITRPREILTHRAQTPEEVPQPLFPVTPDLGRVFLLEEKADKEVDAAWQFTPALKGEAEFQQMSGKLQLLLKETGLEGSSYFQINMDAAWRQLAVATVAMQLKYQPPMYWESLLEDEDYEKDPASGEMIRDPMTNQPILKQEIQEGLAKLQDEKNPVDLMNWDVEVKPGSSLSSSDIAETELRMELATTPIHPDAVLDADAVIEAFPYAGKAALKKRKSKLRQTTQELMKVTEDNKQLIETSQKLDQENKKLKDDLIEQDKEADAEKEVMKIAHAAQLAEVKNKLDRAMRGI